MRRNICCEVSGTPSGCDGLLTAYRRSPLRFDLRLLSRNPAGCQKATSSSNARTHADRNCTTVVWAGTKYSAVEAYKSACHCGLWEIQASIEAASAGRENK